METSPSKPLPLVTHARGGGKALALTFDDGPNGASTHALLDVLAARGVRGVFCVVGQQVALGDGAGVLRRIVGEGHALGNHSMTYADLGNWGPQRVEADLRETLATIRAAVGDVQVPWYRAPNGSWGCSAEVAARLGMRSLGVVGTIDDWRTQDVPTLVANLRSAVTPGGLVVAHDGGGDRRGTVAAVATVVDELLADGWSFVLPDPHDAS